MVFILIIFNVSLKKHIKMRTLILDKYGSLYRFAKEHDLSPQRVNYWVSKDKDLSPAIYDYVMGLI